MARATTALIDSAALRHNLRQVRQAAPSRQVFAAVKANAYGHGLVPVARLLARAGTDADVDAQNAAVDGFAVAAIDEALALRQAGIRQPILLLEGVFEPAELALCAEQRLIVAVHHSTQLDWLERCRPDSLAGHRLAVWLKIDSGMHRLGFAPETAGRAWQRLLACPAVAPPPGLMSHLANADATDSDDSERQQQQFAAVAAALGDKTSPPAVRSLANSAGVLAWPQTHYDCVRPGLMLYGANPLHGSRAAQCRQAFPLRPAMTLQTRLIAVNRIAKGERVGYGGAFCCPEDMDIGIAAIGYGDGYPREVPNATPVLVNDRPAGLVGRVSMDMLAVDLRAHPEARVGDPVVLWGNPRLPVETIAEAAGTIPYTLLTGITSRVRFEYR